MTAPLESQAGGRSVCLVSRQRLVGATNGSSVYLLSIVAYLASRGVDVHYVCPTPSVFGRWPWLRLRPELDVFTSYGIRGGWRFGSLVVNPRPLVWLQAAVAVLDVALMRAGLTRKPLGKPAAHSILTPEPLSAADRAYLARVGRPVADVILCDYASTTPAIPAIGRADARTAIVMHDLFSAHYAGVSAEQEFERLGSADLVIAIQQEEADAVRARLPAQDVIVSPLAMQPVGAAVPGNGDRLLFVASHTAPNVEALNWLAQEVWPLVRARAPHLTLDVAGTVARGVGPMPAGIRLLGLVDDLDAAYAEAGLVVSPLRSGTGLKIKLIEALSRGKAMVITEETARGVRHLVGDAAVVADDPAGFAEAVIRLSADEAARSKLGEAAIALVATHFSAERCYGPIYDRLLGPRSEPRAPSAAPGPLSRAG